MDSSTSSPSLFLRERKRYTTLVVHLLCITVLKDYAIMYIVKSLWFPALLVSASAFMPNMIPSSKGTRTALNMADFTLDPKETALVFIEYQNEFTTEGGKLHEAVKDVMEKTNSEI